MLDGTGTKTVLPGDGSGTFCLATAGGACMPVSHPGKGRISALLLRAKLHRAALSRSPRKHKLGEKVGRDTMWGRGSQRPGVRKGKRQERGSLLMMQIGPKSQTTN